MLLIIRGKTDKFDGKVKIFYYELKSLSIKKAFKN